MSFKQATIRGTAGGYSLFVGASPSAGLYTGSIACVDDEDDGTGAWVRVIQVGDTNPAPVTTSGANAGLTGSPETPPYTDGWTHIYKGQSLPFGGEAINERGVSQRAPVVQIDIYVESNETEVAIFGHG